MTDAVSHRGEFGRIAKYFAPLTASFPGAFDLRDDAAVLSPRSGCELVVTTDTVVQGVHYLGDETPDLIAAKLLRVNLSDLAAMGASARAYTLNIALPPETGDVWVERFAAGLAAEQQRFNIALIGGDSVSTAGPAVLTVTAYGEVPSGCALRRAGAAVGDIVFVSGTIGDGALGLRALRNQLNGVSEDGKDYLADRYRRPQPRLALGGRLVGMAHAAADVSDGLVADLNHIAAASGVGAIVEAASVPLSDAARMALAADSALLETALTGGDDYELVFCVAKDSVTAAGRLAKELEVPLTAIGRVVEGDGVRVQDAAGTEIPLRRPGFTHG